MVSVAGTVSFLVHGTEAERPSAANWNLSRATDGNRMRPRVHDEVDRGHDRLQNVNEEAGQLARGRSFIARNRTRATKKRGEAQTTVPLSIGPNRIITLKRSRWAEINPYTNVG